MMRSDSDVSYGTATEEMFVPPEFTRRPTVWEKTMTCRNSCLGFFYLLCCVPCYFCCRK